jgi:hypothetical protein
MADQTCGVCKKKQAQWTCNECGTPLCDVCVREVRIDSTRPGQRMQGRITSPLKSATRRLKVCEKCAQEVEFLED